MALESSPEQPQPLRAVVTALKGWVERTGAVWVEGQVIQVKRRAGYAVHFLTLRDKLADVSVQVSISTAVLDAAGPVPEGTLVAAWVRATVFPGSGSLTFECRDLRPSGEGRLLAHLEQRKRALQAEGLFDPALKKRLPFLPRAIGLVTGKDSAAERDVVENVLRRWPAAHIVTRHALVQGQQAVEQVTDAVRALDRSGEVDVIVIARGGGSLEDLLPFSDETLARAVHACRTPVVSAIGHEPDVPILDLVADVRASTPTDAAKLVVPDAAEEARVVATGRDRLREAVVRRVRSEQDRLGALRSRPVLADPSGAITLQSERLTEIRARLGRGVRRALEREDDFLSGSLARVRALSPRATLQRGYAIVTTDDGRTVASIADVEPDETIIARLLDGDIAAAVIDVEPHAHEEHAHEEER
ncbi:exodeoxyribonuclease VII large subunit [Propioniciclava soli]|uniref:exodeoxyribonuclease VII large subunit n=1 Tax=Propioniciclava soli TaxID=2775081 RepID=UPI001E2AB36B|nr:exodeoxyribonuclease VII large subunit [Propioniciclava soli]